MLFADADSLMFHIEIEDIEKDMQLQQDIYDTSDYSFESFAVYYHDIIIIGKFKDELNGRPSVEFVGLRAKMDSLLSEDNV